MPKKNLISNAKKEEEIKTVFEKFQKYNKSKNLSESTIKYYKNNFKRFNNYLKRNNIEKIGNITREIIDNYRHESFERTNNATSVNTYLRAIRTFLNFAIKRNYLRNIKVEMLNEEEKIKPTYTDKEIELLLEKPNLKEVGFAEYRNWVIINWLLATGNRARTVRNIKIKDLDFESGFVRIRKTKNKRQQLIPLGREITRILQEYLEYRDGENEDWLFPTIYNDQMKQDSLVSAIRRYNLSRGITKTSTHLFRHTFAKKWILNGGDMFRLQKILGHRSMEMVKEYVNMFSDDLKEGFEKYNPLNEFKSNKSKIKMNK